LEAVSRMSGITNPSFNYVNQVLINKYAKTPAAQEPGIARGKKKMSIADVHKYYDVLRKKAENDAESRKEEVYSKVPKVKEIDEELRLSAFELSKAMISGSSDRKQQSVKLKNKVNRLSKQRADLLLENGFCEDYTETKYRCEMCKDSGINDNDERCSCFKEIQSEAEAWRISSKN